MVDRWNRKVSKDDEEDEEIVDRKRLLNYVSGEIFLAELATEFAPDPCAEDDCNGDIEN